MQGVPKKVTKSSVSVKGAGGGLNQNSLEIDFIDVSDRGE